PRAGARLGGRHHRDVPLASRGRTGHIDRTEVRRGCGARGQPRGGPRACHRRAGEHGTAGRARAVRRVAAPGGQPAQPGHDGGPDRCHALRPLPRAVHGRRAPAPRRSEMAAYNVVVEKDYLVFASGHFITYGGLCEALHGHNYRARVELEGEVDENSYVFDFDTLKGIMRRLVDEIDHEMLHPRENPHLELREEGSEIEVRYGDRRYVFPRDDVVLLPIPNT